MANNVEDIEALASSLHDLFCSRNCISATRAFGDSHQRYYYERAHAIYMRLEPKIGVANILPAAEAFVDELW